MYEVHSGAKAQQDIQGISIGSVAKWQCCPLREATSAALPYTRRAGFWAVHKSTRPVQPGFGSSHLAQVYRGPLLLR